jgi:hypothetical protein
MSLRAASRLRDAAPDMTCKTATIRFLFAIGFSAIGFACGDDGQSDGETGETNETGDGDGDGDPGDGDGDGDGDPGDGDGDAIPTAFEIGFHVADLSPDDVDLADEFYLGGYGFYTERGAAQGVHDPIYVRSMAIGYGPSDGGIFAIVDTVGMGNLWTRQVRASVAANTGLSEEQVVISSTHTHAGPDLQGLWGGVPDPYRERIIDAMIDSMTTAWNQRERAELTVGTLTADNRNRRDWGYTDEALTALQAFAIDDGALLGTAVIFAAHPVVLDSDNLLVSRDFCGYAVDSLELSTGAPALYWNGVQGDVSPVVPEGTYADDFERAEAYGEHVAARTLLALEASETVSVEFHRAYQSFELAVTNELFLFAAQGGLLDYEFDLRGSAITTQTAYFRFGDQLQLLTFPGESLTRNGLPVREAMGAPHQAIMGLSSDSLGYFVPTDEWNTGLNDDYEESVSVGMAAGDITRDLMIELIGSDPG